MDWWKYGIFKTVLNINFNLSVFQKRAYFNIQLWKNLLTVKLKVMHIF